MNDILISEIFGSTLQGEGALIGRQTVFVRTGGCDFRCNWCVAPETPITLADWNFKAARDVQVGDEIIGLARRENVPEAVGTYQRGTVLGVVTRHAPRVKVAFEDGREICVASEHAFVDIQSGRFREACELRAGDGLRVISNSNSSDECAQVERVDFVDEGELVSIKTSLGTYIANDLVSRNCDTLYAVLPEHKSQWRKMSPGAILEEVEKLSGGHPILITLSGGNPALQPLELLIDEGHARGHTFCMETQGSKSPHLLSKLDHLVLSPKPPSSMMEFRPEALARCLEVAGQKPQVSLKVVVFDEADYAFARRVHDLHPHVPFYLSVGNPAPLESHAVDTGDLTARLEWLMERCARDGWFTPTILPQLHVLLWGNKRGV